MAGEPTLLDTSVLLQATFSDLPWHNAAWRLLDRARNGEGNYCVCAHNLSELAWLMSDGTQVGAPDSPELVRQKLREFLGAGFLRKLSVTPAVLLRQADLIGKLELSGPRTFDALVVAAMLENGVSLIYTLHPREFEAFTQIRAANPFV